MVRYRVVISGQVQGVSFRVSCQRMAWRHGVAGWVRNLSDGSVEAVFEGPAGEVQRLLDWSRRGPGMAVVAGVTLQPEQPEGLSSFQIK